MKNLKDREKIYNEVIQEYSELLYFPKRDKYNRHYDDVQNIITNLVDLVMEYGDVVYRSIWLDELEFHQLKDKEYLTIIVETWINDYEWIKNTPKKFTN